MNYASLLLPRRSILLAVLAVTACESRDKDNDLQNLPGPNGLNADGSPPRSPPPRAPDPGTYTGLDSRYGSRPPRSGLNSDPANPSGAPGGSGGPGYSR